MCLTGECVQIDVGLIVERISLVRVGPRSAVGSHWPEVGAPSLAAGILLEPFLLGTPVLEPDLDDAHVESGLGAELLAHVTSRFRTLVVGPLQGLELFGGDRCPRPLVGVVQVELCTSPKKNSSSVPRINKLTLLNSLTVVS